MISGEPEAFAASKVCAAQPSSDSGPSDAAAVSDAAVPPRNCAAASRAGADAGEGKDGAAVLVAVRLLADEPLCHVHEIIRGKINVEIAAHRKTVRAEAHGAAQNRDRAVEEPVLFYVCRLFECVDVAESRRRVFLS